MKLPSSRSGHAKLLQEQKERESRQRRLKAFQTVLCLSLKSLTVLRVTQKTQMIL